MEEALKDKGLSFKQSVVTISGSGNVAIFATEKATEMGAKVVAMSDSDGYIHDPAGVDLDLVKEIKLVRRGRIKEYVEARPASTIRKDAAASGRSPVISPCRARPRMKLTVRTRNCWSRMAAKPSAKARTCRRHRKRSKCFLKNKLIFAPAKAANAGGVATSALEMTQNSMRLSWTFEEVDAKLKDIMVNIYKNASAAAAEYGDPDNLMLGANIAGFLKVAAAMYQQGIAY
jgi:glutamate dehydrogenase (NADP+)